MFGAVRSTGALNRPEFFAESVGSFNHFGALDVHDLHKTHETVKGNCWSR